MAKAPRLVLRQVTTAQRWIRVISIVVLLAGIASGSYMMLRAQLPYDWEQFQLERERMDSQRDALNRELRRLRKEYARQTEQVVELQRGADMDREALAELRTALRDLQGELESQREQLTFYRGIISPEESHAGMRIYGLTVEPAGETTNHYSFDLMLMQPLQHQRRVSGSIRLSVQGLQDGKETVLEASELGMGGTGPLKYSFRYFQELHGTLVFPENFQPTVVLLHIQSATHRSVNFEKSYPWKELWQTNEAET